MERFRILLGVPSSGMISETSGQASWLPSLHHRVNRVPSCLSGPNYNACLVGALNACQDGQYTHHAQIHADLDVVEEEKTCHDCRGEKCFECGYRGTRVYKRWLDVLVEEMEKFGADFISVPMAIKDHTGATSCGIGDPNNRWGGAFRRFCINEFKNFPATFTAEDVGYGDRYLIHNHALCLFDMRKPLWWTTDAEGCIRAMFNFSERIERNTLTGKWQRSQDSEDWAFSRELWKLGAKTCITSLVRTLHHGSISFDNVGDECLWQNGDEGTAAKWRPKTVAV